MCSVFKAKEKKMLAHWQMLLKDSLKGQRFDHIGSSADPGLHYMYMHYSTSQCLLHHQHMQHPGTPSELPERFHAQSQ